MKIAHIVHPEVKVGEKALAVCGEKIKVSILWGDLAPDHPTCRDCIEVLITATNEVNEQVADASLYMFLAGQALDRETSMSEVLDDGNAYHTKQMVKAQAKAARRAERKAAKKAAKKRRKHGDDAPVAPPTTEQDS